MTRPNPAERGAQVHFPPPLVFLGFVLLGLALQYAVTPIALGVDRWTRLIAGLLILSAGLSLGATASMHFSRTGQHPAPWRPSPELIREGPYRFTRNPMYVGLTLLQVGLGVAADDLWIALFAVPALLVVHYIAVLAEEKYLVERFGEPYAAYRARVRRYV
jgi:protein-S-isoprenylcysteine O-methyltransferase Ste14